MKLNIVQRLDGRQRDRRTDTVDNVPKEINLAGPVLAKAAAGCTVHLSTILSKACQERQAVVAKNRCASLLNFSFTLRPGKITEFWKNFIDFFREWNKNVDFTYKMAIFKRLENYLIVIVWFHRFQQNNNISYLRVK